MIRLWPHPHGFSAVSVVFPTRFCSSAVQDDARRKVKDRTMCPLCAFSQSKGHRVNMKEERPPFITLRAHMRVNAFGKTVLSVCFSCMAGQKLLQFPWAISLLSFVKVSCVCIRAHSQCSEAVQLCHSFLCVLSLLDHRK